MTKAWGELEKRITDVRGLIDFESDQAQLKKLLAEDGANIAKMAVVKSDPCPFAQIERCGRKEISSACRHCQTAIQFMIDFTTITTVESYSREYTFHKDRQAIAVVKKTISIEPM